MGSGAPTAFGVGEALFPGRSGSAGNRSRAARPWGLKGSRILHSLCDPRPACVPLCTQDLGCQERQLLNPWRALQSPLWAWKSWGGPQSLGVPLQGLAAGVGAARRTGAASMSYKVPL